MRVLVNGASGYIGLYLVKELLDNNDTVFAVSRRSNSELDFLKNNKNLTIINSTQDRLYSNIRGYDIDVWYQLVWDGVVGKRKTDINVQMSDVSMSVDAISTANKVGCSKIIYTGSVYERMIHDVIESDNFIQNSFYIICKHHTHDLTLQLSKEYGMDFVWCQFCHPIGVGMNPKQMIPSIIEAYSRNLDIKLGRCDQPYDIISVKSLVYALRTIGMQANKKNEYYIGSGHPRILKEYILKLAEICGYHKPLSFGQRVDDGMRYKYEWFDTSDFVDEYGNKL